MCSSDLPLLIMAGAEDTRVDPSQSMELYRHIKTRTDTPVGLVLYPGEGHGINRPSHMIDYQTRELAWFRHYLLDDAEAEGPEPAVPVEP